MGIFSKFTGKDPAQLSDKLDALVSAAKGAADEKARAKAAEKIVALLAGIDDVALLDAVYRKQPYRYEEAKELVINRYFEILEKMTDIHAVQRIARGPYSHPFTNNASLTVARLTSASEDDDLMRAIVREDSGFDFRARDIAALKLRGDTVPVAELLDISRGKRASTTFLSVRAAAMLESLPALEELAFDSTNLSEVVMVAQLKLLQMSRDVAVLRKLAEQTEHPLFRDTALQRVAELSGR